MATPPRSAVTERVWSRLPEGCRQVLEDELSPTDLQSLLLSLAQTRAGRIRPAEVLRRWKSDRFVRPATVDPGRLSQVENRLWRRLRDTPFEGLALSPVTSLGTCTSVGAVDQNRIVSTVRSSEVVSDPCNVLALEAALRRRSNNDQVHLASCHRVLRAQQFVESEAFAHFVIFALVSSARDSGSARTEAELLIMHLSFWQQALDELLGPTWGRFAYTLIGDQSKGHPLVDMIQSELPATPLTAYPERTQGIGYYHTAAFQDPGEYRNRRARDRRWWLCWMDCRADSGRKGALSDLLRSSRTPGRFDAGELGRTFPEFWDRLGRLSAVFGP